jgi:hypothetical protein
LIVLGGGKVEGSGWIGQLASALAVRGTLGRGAHELCALGRGVAACALGRGAG